MGLVHLMLQSIAVFFHAARSGLWPVMGWLRGGGCYLFNSSRCTGVPRLGPVRRATNRLVIGWLGEDSHHSFITGCCPKVSPFRRAGLGLHEVYGPLLSSFGCFYSGASRHEPASNSCILLLTMYTYSLLCSCFSRILLY